MGMIDPFRDTSKGNAVTMQATRAHLAYNFAKMGGTSPRVLPVPTFKGPASVFFHTDIYHTW